MEFQIISENRNKKTGEYEINSVLKMNGGLLFKNQQRIFLPNGTWTETVSIVPIPGAFMEEPNKVPFKVEYKDK